LGGCAGVVCRTGVEHRPESESNQWFARNPVGAPEPARAKSCPAAHRSGRGVGLGIAWGHPRVPVVSRAAHGRVIDSTRARLCRPMAVAELRYGWRVSGRRKGGRVPALPLPGSASRAPPPAVRPRRGDGHRRVGCSVREVPAATPRPCPSGGAATRNPAPVVPWWTQCQAGRSLSIWRNVGFQHRGITSSIS
jgi:hypothetical protein